MGNAITNKDDQLSYLKQRLELFLDVLEGLDPEEASLEDIDRLIAMIEDLERKMTQFNK
ncbi:SE1561 family protein [Bacillus fonticola]|uniref:SE1561 family protein n=1 Tax=Bacillus fonticola TaxID=2728853 RepID=UPI0014740342|nr:SE1561 family protein [Bacillus fonticola]